MKELVNVLVLLMIIWTTIITYASYKVYGETFKFALVVMSMSILTLTAILINSCVIQ